MELRSEQYKVAISECVEAQPWTNGGGILQIQPPTNLAIKAPKKEALVMLMTSICAESFYGLH